MGADFGKFGGTHIGGSGKPSSPNTKMLSTVVKYWLLNCFVFRFRNHLHKTVEQIAGIVGAGRGFRVVLHRKCLMLFQSDSLNGIVVQVDVRYFDVLPAHQLVGTDAESVVLAGDFGAASH